MFGRGNLVLPVLFLGASPAPWGVLASSVLVSPHAPIGGLSARASVVAAQAAPPVSGISKKTGLVTMDPDGIYIRATQPDSATLLAAYAAQDDGKRAMRVVKSTDGAQSWVHIGTVGTQNSTTFDFDNADILAVNESYVLCAYRNHSRTAAGDYTEYRIQVSVSEDQGKTWAFLSTVVERTADGFNGVWEPAMRLSREGDVQLYYSSESGQFDQQSYMVTSESGGATWSSTKTTVSGTSGSRDGMIGVVSVTGENLIAVFEETERFLNAGPLYFAISFVTSSDDGASWGNRTRLFTPSDGYSTGAPQVVNVNGTLVASFMINKGSSVDSGQMWVVASVDGGATWSASTQDADDGYYVAGGTGSHWPGMIALGDSEFVALYSFDDAPGAISEVYQLEMASNSGSNPSSSSMSSSSSSSSSSTAARAAAARTGKSSPQSSASTADSAAATTGTSSPQSSTATALSRPNRHSAVAIPAIAASCTV